MFPKFVISALVAGAATPVLADAPRVATDIAPVHSLVSMVMAGVGMPDLIVEPGANPHGYALRPSQARALQNADLVIWMGETLTPWMEKPVDTLAGRSAVIELLDQEATHLLPYREGHDDHDDHDDAHDDHDDDHEDAHDDHEDAHDHEGADPHAWLDPDNAVAWLSVIAGELAQIDPEHADLYKANAAAGQARIEGIVADIQQTLAPMKGHPFAAFHDAYQYFEVTFDLTLAGTVTLGDAADPSPARLDELRTILHKKGVDCAFIEPQFNGSLLIAAAEGQEMQILELDPLGSRLETGLELYSNLLKGMADTMAKCVVE